MKPILLILISLITCLSAATKDLLVHPPEQLYSSANADFDKANFLAMSQPAAAQELYQSAILKYQFLAKNHPSADLNMNLANTYFSSGDHGRAALFYQRALRIDPTHQNTLHNLHYLRSLTIDALPESRFQKIQKSLLFWHHWSFQSRLWICGLANLICFSLLAAILYHHRHRWIWISLSASAALTLIFAISLTTTFQGWDQTIDGVIVQKELIARKGNGLIYDNAFTTPLHSGTEFQTLETRGDWLHAKLLDGSTCWLPTNGCESVTGTF
ncbi:tetratricopeptide repeat protein [Rubritalea tangerina]|uniref:Tetratricopeptide repeat protein n=2 Tax=Rubritalea tangerina TaxID=430798 RepID=A0ABW4ZCV3_9BACT